MFRRGDSFFNFLRKDWRQAKAAFTASSKRPAKLGAVDMADRFSAILSWQASQAAFDADAHLKEAAGPLFQGIKTDFEKIRKLHQWVRESQEALLPTQLASTISPVSWSEGNLKLLASSASKIHTWLSKLAQLSRFVKELPGFDPALLRSRKVDELLKPLEEYAKSLIEGAASLKLVARPTASVHRALELVDLAKQLDEHGDLLVSLIAAPAPLAQVAGPWGCPTASSRIKT